MPITFVEENDGRLLSVTVRDKLERRDYELLAPEIDRLVDRHGKINLLVRLDDFSGWEPAALWEDLKLAISAT